MADEDVQWLVKNRDGLTEGPFGTGEIIQKIRAGYYQGEESIQRYPSGQWRAISYEEKFFDELLESLEDELNDDKSRVLVPPVINQKPSSPPMSVADKRAQPPPVGKIVAEGVNEETPAVLDVEPARSSQSRIKERARRGRAVEEVDKASPSERRRSDRRSSRRQGKGQLSLREIRSARRRTRFLVAALVVVIGSIIFFMDPSQQRRLDGKRLRLLPPNFNVTDSPRKTATLNQAIQYFRRDTIEDYAQAMKILVEYSETTKKTDGLNFLCMVYRELWPAAYQDTEDLKTVDLVLRAAQLENPESQSATTCLVVKEWVNGRYREALRIMDVYLSRHENLLFFNQMSGDIKADAQSYEEAVYYFQRVHEFWEPKPVWAKTILQLARMKRKLGAQNEANILYSSLLKYYPKHAVGQIEYGMLLFETGEKRDLITRYIRNGLSQRQRIPKAVEAEAYFTLAKVARVQGDKRSALKNAQNAFAIDSSMKEAKQFIVALGGTKALDEITIENANLVYLGEQYMKMGKYTSAQGQFRAAFASDKKNAFAALRAGQALWELNQGKEAISWVKKAVIADPKYIPSYVVLADYLSQRFDYLNAIAALKQAKRVNPRHYLVWRGFALVELRRRNYDGAIVFAEKARSYYETDIESLLILARAHHALRDEEKAYEYVLKATELDRSNEEVIGTHAKVLTALQGALAGEQYLQQKIGEFSNKLSFRRTLGEIYMNEQKFDRAIEVFNEILAIDAADKASLLLMAKALQLKQRRENYQAAREYLMEAAALDPSDAEPLFQLAQLYLEAGQAGYAKANFERVIQVNERYPLAHYFLGRAALKMGSAHFQEALDMAKLESRLNPEIPEPYLLSGETYFKMSIYNQDANIKNSYATSCAQDFQKAIALGYRFADGYIWLARCLRLTGSLDTAESMLDEAEKLESGNPDIYRELGALNEMKGVLDKAVFWYERYLKLSPQAKDSGEIKTRIQMLRSKGEQQ